jgi:hypothetical protein
MSALFCCGYRGCSLASLTLHTPTPNPLVFEEPSESTRSTPSPVPFLGLHALAMGHNTGFFTRFYQDWSITDYIEYMRRNHANRTNRQILGTWTTTLRSIMKCTKCCSVKRSERASELLKAYQKKVRPFHALRGRPRGPLCSSKRPLCSLWAGRVGMAPRARLDVNFLRVLTDPQQ